MVGRSLATIALLFAIVVLTLVAMFGSSSTTASAPKFSKPIAGKSVSGAPSRRA